MVCVRVSCGGTALNPVAKMPEVMWRRGSTSEVTPSKSSGSGEIVTVWLGIQYSVRDHWGRAPLAHAGAAAGLKVSMYLTHSFWELSDWLCTFASRGYREAPGNNVGCLFVSQDGSHIRQSGIPRGPQNLA